MTRNTIVHTLIDEEIKEEATVVLASMGLTVSDDFRLMLTRVAKEKTLPFDPLIPNAATIRTMKETREGKNLKLFNSVDDLMDDLNIQHFDPAEHIDIEDPSFHSKQI